MGSNKTKKKMKNDLTPYERDLLKVINLYNRTNYNYKNLMEWSSNKDVVQGRIRDGEIMYESLGMFVAIKP